MYISKISLKNIRGFKSLEFDLDRGNGEFAGWTVFTGSNGSGKSTLLKAIAYVLISSDAQSGLQPRFEFFLSKSPAGPEHEILINFARSDTDDKFPDDYFHGEIPVYEEFALFHSAASMTCSGVFTHLQISGNPIEGWFSCGYGPFRRISAAKENVEQIQKTKDTERFATLFLEGATLSEVNSWLTQLRFQQLEGSNSAGDQLGSFLEFVRDGLLPDGFSVDRVDSRGLWLKDSHGVELSWFEMSDGHRTAIILLADIVRHMIQAYGLDGLYVRDERGKIYIKRSGVVLIDEIDAHLHPSWQRQIGFWLKEHFPNVQFLVTSHSPIILQAADPNGLFVLPEPGSEDEPHPLTPDEYQKVIASRTDSILRSPAFGLETTLSEPVVEKLARFSKLQSKRRAGAKLSAGEENDLQGLLPFVKSAEGG